MLYFLQDVESKNHYTQLFLYRCAQIGTCEVILMSRLYKAYFGSHANIGWCFFIQVEDKPSIDHPR